jgi:hypothetical protein
VAGHACKTAFAEIFIVPEFFPQRQQFFPAFEMFASYRFDIGLIARVAGIARVGHFFIARVAWVHPFAARIARIHLLHPLHVARIARIAGVHLFSARVGYFFATRVTGVHPLSV